jgi:uncharacterized protein YqhQ
MKTSGIGGQAVLEGIMMRNGSKYAVAVRKPDKEIAVVENTYKSLWGDSNVTKLPFIRGVFNFIDSMVLGVKTINISADYFAEYDEEDGAAETSTGTGAMKAAEKAAEAGTGTGSKKASEAVTGTGSKKADETGTGREAAGKAAEAADKKSFLEKHFTEDQINGAIMAVTMAVSFLLAMFIFMMIPVWVASLFKKLTDSYAVIALLEGVLRVLIFVVYILLIGQIKDIKRTYMYHGAEHKCINCIETGLPLTVENVGKSSKVHKRCGTSFLLFVMLISVFFFMFIHIDNIGLRMLSRVVLIPVIAGISYEFIRLAGSTDNPVVNALSKPGLWMQALTTKEPEPDMIEVAIQAVEKVFDWRAYQEENFKSSAA